MISSVSASVKDCVMSFPQEGHCLCTDENIIAYVDTLRNDKGSPVKRSIGLNRSWLEKRLVEVIV